jgi:archaeosine synthase
MPQPTPTAPEGGDITYLAPGATSFPGTPVVALANGPEYLRHPREFAQALSTLRRGVGYGRLLYLPGLAVPWNLALLVYCGADLLDSVRASFEARRGVAMTADGGFPPGDVACDCPPCLQGHTASDPLAHNQLALLRELRQVRRAVASGWLRELVERRLANDPWNTAVLRHMDLRHYRWQEYHTPVVGGPVRAYSRDSLTRPEVVRFRRRVRERYSKPPSTRVLLLLPCSARKPYSTSRSHRLFREAVAQAGNPLAVHVVVVTSPLGIVPGELEAVHPVQTYDIPVTGDWSLEEQTTVREDLEAYLARNKYDACVVHLGTEAGFIEDLLPGAAFTAQDHPTSAKALEALTAALREEVGSLDRVNPSTRTHEDAASLLRFQFGPDGVGLIEGCRIVGRYPNWRILREGQQLAMLSGSRGLFALTLEGAQEVSSRGLSWVEIEDFQPKGNVFAVGVEAASPDLRIGDEAVVRHEGDVRAVGVAQMTPAEMVELSRGEAVRVRHRKPSPPLPTTPGERA